MGNDQIADVTSGEGDTAGIDYELVIDSDAGTAILTCGGEVMWTSDQDSDYAEERNGAFIDIDDDDAVDELFDWLVGKGYAPPGVEYDVVDLEASMRELD